MPIARAVGETMIWAVLVIVVLLSRRRGAVGAILVGLVVTLASFSLGPEWSSIAASLLRHGGGIVLFSALTWVVAQAVYAPGRITFRHRQAAGVLHLNLATIFASVFSLIWELSPFAFAGLPPPTRSEPTRHDDVFQPHYADHDRLWRHRTRSLANLGSVLGQFYLVITVARDGRVQPRKFKFALTIAVRSWWLSGRRKGRTH